MARSADQRAFARARRAITTALVAAVAGTAAATGPATPAQAAVPDVAQTWSTLMYRSLTANTEAVRLRTALTTQQAAVTARGAGVATARTANDAAQARLARTSAADVAARSRYKDATATLTAANKNLQQVSAQRPRSAAAVTTATKAVAVAEKEAGARWVDVRYTATALRNARSSVRSAATALATATAAWDTASTAAGQTQAKLAALPNGAALAGEATALSRDVVTQVRTAFTTADTTVIYGVTVHKNVSYAFKRMLDDARAQGIVLSGGGFRTTQRQIELRTINGCPDVWTAPASSCRVPTAIPGRSLHELGLAVDITAGGRTLTAKSPGFIWLVGHAGRYGFVNLPSEAWHWSITGS
jgi:D-alanyl-D-alanine carboxypeptidase